MESQVELEICANCKREIPHTNYVMHTAHCARNISVCSTCKEPFPKADIEKHQKSCVRISPPKPIKKVPPTKLEESSYFAARKAVEDKKVSDRQAKRLERLERLVGTTSQSSGHADPPKPAPPVKHIPTTNIQTPVHNYATPIGSSKSSLLPCQYCELELPKLDLEDHESYCGARTERCEDCGEMVMFRDKNAHRDSNHRLRNSKLKSTSLPSQPRRSMSSYEVPLLAGATAAQPTEKFESSREISRRLDCKTEYIRNLLHDSANITAPLRSTGAIPRNKGATRRRQNPPTEIVIPCEFCNTPIPHEELIEHETGCRPDLARYNPRRRDSSPEEYPSREPTSPDVDIPCEFCSDLIPASQFLIHQATCSCN